MRSAGHRASERGDKWPSQEVGRPSGLVGEPTIRCMGGLARGFPGWQVGRRPGGLVDAEAAEQADG